MSLSNRSICFNTIPNESMRSIALAIFESYITTRNENDWKIDPNINLVDDNGLSSLPEVQSRKLSICYESIQKIMQASTLDDWLSVLDFLNEKEVAELKIYKKSWSFKFPMICDTLHAVRTYLISNIKTHDYFVELKQKLNDTRIKLEKDVDWNTKNKQLQNLIEEEQKELDAIKKTIDIRNDSDDYHFKFFKAHIMNDPTARVLKEQTFERFTDNVLSQARRLTLCGRWFNLEIKPTNESPEPTPAKDIPKKEDADIPKKTSPYRENSFFTDVGTKRATIRTTERRLRSGNTYGTPYEYEPSTCLRTYRRH